MDFLADVWVTCPVCEGHRFNRETLQVRFKDKSIADVLEMDVQQALEHFENVPKIRHKLQTLHDVGLDYLKLGQPSPTLSGGEAQRIKLARELVQEAAPAGRCTCSTSRRPACTSTTSSMLLKVLHDFVDAGNTVLVVEHNLDVIKTADWIIDLGPEGGAGGGRGRRRRHAGGGRASAPSRTPGRRSRRCSAPTAATNGKPKAASGERRPSTAARAHHAHHGRRARSSTT